MLKYICIFLLTIQIASAQNYLVQDYLPAIASQKIFDQLKGEPLNNLYSGIQCVKLCYDIASKKLYFINSTRYRFHIDFCNKIFNEEYDVAEFNKTNYTNNLYRKYILGTLNYYENQGIYTLEFVSEDDVPIMPLQDMYVQISKNVFFKSPIYLLLNNAYLLDNQKKFGVIPITFPEKIFAAQTYQPLVLGKTQGIARRITNLQKQFKTIQATDIIFFDGTPLTLPDCKAVVTSTLQTPLSHINVLCNNRKTPACAFTKMDSAITAMHLWDSTIELEVAKDKINIKKVSGKNVIANLQKPRKKIVIQSDIVTKDLQIFANQKKYSAKNIGSKAYGVSQLYKIQNSKPNLFNVPAAAFGIPFYYYQQHINQPKIQIELKKLFAIPLAYKDSITIQLKKVRKAIKNAPVAEALLQLVQAQLHKNNNQASYRFRSSSNAEDIVGFNGAGLYESYSGSLVDTNKKIDNVIRKVWASVWNENAFLERALFGIDNKSVLMGILVHQGFLAEEANGVAITKNLFRKDYPGFTINVQQGEVSVVAPNDSITCDQFVCFTSEDFYAEKGEVYEQYITRSNITNGINVLTHAQVGQLYAALLAIKNYIYFRNPNNYRVSSFEDFGLDLEFKLDDNKLYIKQVRSYQ